MASAELGKAVPRVLPLSVLILTYNEEANIAGCLESVSYCDDVWVLDSLSSDQTKELCTLARVEFHEREFDNYANQRNHGLSFPFRHEWVLMLDADERLTPRLAKEIESVLASDSKTDLFRVRRKDMFMDRWIRRSSGYPTWFGRLFRQGKVRVERAINEEYETDGEVGLLKEHLEHYPFNKGIDYWIERHNKYSTMEADRLRIERREPINWTGFLATDPALRRKSFKQLAYRLPFRPLLTFLYLYVVRGGFLDGRPGFHYSCMRATYEYMILLKMMRPLRSSQT